jgi:hypothetical protein
LGSKSAGQRAGASASLRYVEVPPTCQLGGLRRCPRNARRNKAAHDLPGGRSWAARFMRLRHSTFRRQEILSLTGTTC